MLTSTTSMQWLWDLAQEYRDFVKSSPFYKSVSVATSSADFQWIRQLYYLSSDFSAATAIRYGKCDDLSFRDAFAEHAAAEVEHPHDLAVWMREFGFLAPDEAPTSVPPTLETLALGAYLIRSVIREPIAHQIITLNLVGEGIRVDFNAHINPKLAELGLTPKGYWTNHQATDIEHQTIGLDLIPPCEKDSPDGERYARIAWEVASLWKQLFDSWSNIAREQKIIVQDNANQLGEIVLKEAVSQAKKEFGSRLIACYGLGSLAHGGFSPLVSDVDFGIILTSPLTPTDEHQIANIKSHVKNLQIALGERLSIFWGSVASLKNEESGGRLSPLDKLDLIQYGKLLAGDDVRKSLSIAEPTRQELEISAAELAVNLLGTSATIAEFAQPATVVDRGVRHLTKVVLFPVRFLYTASTGKIGHNDAAVAYYFDRNTGDKAELVRQAFRWRYEPPKDRYETIKLLERALIPLYLQFIDCYYPQMLHYQERNLAASLKQWRNQLTRIISPQKPQPKPPFSLKIFPVKQRGERGTNASSDKSD